MSVVDADVAGAGPGREILNAIAALGTTGLAARREELEHLVRAEGATSLGPGSPAGPRGRWTIDPVPLVLDAKEWSTIERGVAERASLLDLILCDAYGQRDLLRQGLLPAEQVLGHPGFLRPCAEPGRGGERRLVLYAADLARSPDGRFRVLADWAQAPAGLGYALFNRRMLSRVLPDLVADARVQRLTSFFRALRDAFERAVPPTAGEPRVVMLSPGPAAPGHFEHAYLAAHLGFPLVEGDDLVVHDGRLWVRQLAGGGPVDVVFRWVDDRLCDPVELEGASSQGVPGLVGVLRHGGVAVVNPLGGGIIENPALSRFLPAISRRVGGAELALSGARTWWCGRREDRRYVQDHLDELVLRSVDLPGGQVVTRASAWGAQERQEWVRRMQAEPWRWVGQEPLPTSVVPAVRGDGAFIAQPAIVRVFAVADGDGYSVLPGGLTFIGGEADSPFVPGRLNGPTKDTWVPVPGREDRAWPLRLPFEDDPLSGPPERVVLPNRVAGHLMALGRANEAAELLIRLARAALALTDVAEDAVPPTDGVTPLAILDASVRALVGPSAGVRSPTAAAPSPARVTLAPLRRPASDRGLLHLLLDADRPGSLTGSLERSLEAANSVREQLSADTWQLVGDLEEELSSLRSHPPIRLATAFDRFERLLRSLLAFAGLSFESMERDPSWRFLDVGRRLERAGSTLCLLRSTLVDVQPPPVEEMVLESLLKTADSLFVYKRSQPRLQVAGVLSLLIEDEENPRSVVFQIERLAEHLAVLATEVGERPIATEAEALGELAAQLRSGNGRRLGAAAGGGSRRSALERELARIDRQLGRARGTLERSLARQRRTLLAPGAGRWADIRSADAEPGVGTAGGPAGSGGGGDQ